MNGMDAVRSVRKGDSEVVIVFITNMAFASAARAFW